MSRLSGSLGYPGERPAWQPRPGRGQTYGASTLTLRSKWPMDQHGRVVRPCWKNYTSSSTPFKGSGFSCQCSCVVFWFLSGPGHWPKSSSHSTTRTRSNPATRLGGVLPSHGTHLTRPRLCQTVSNRCHPFVGCLATSSASRHRSEWAGLVA